MAVKTPLQVPLTPFLLFKQTTLQLLHIKYKSSIKMSAFAMTSSSAATQAPTLFGRGGYNGPNEDSEEDSRMPLGGAPLNFGRGGYNRGDDDEEEDGRGGYN
ncbi:hypothetical protein B0O99DRAFT_687390 [Bisporella sp. PMI_857]|nr:hypothetical protein B0O99DRAFT_687390 [Bisporella sp. PMI_857]